ncbi:MAG: amidohydrolase family protein [Minicystis sp.]
MRLTIGRPLVPALTFSLLAALPWTMGCHGEGTASAAVREVGCAGCTVLRGGTVFDGTQAGRGAVVLDHEVVKEVVFGDVTVTKGQVVDVTGKTVLPGLVDMHVHLQADSVPLGGSLGEGGHNEDHLKSMLRAGVTSYLDLGSSAHLIFEYRRRVEAGDMLGPRVFAVGPLLTPTGGHPCYAGSPPGDSCIFIDAPADVGASFSKLVAQGPDLIKVVIEGGAVKPIPRMTEPSVAAIQQAAQSAGIPVIAHVSTAADMEDALTAGVTHFAHMPSEDLVTPALAQKLVARHAVVVPTAAVMDGFYAVSHGTLAALDDPKLRDDVPDEVIASLRNPKDLSYMTTAKYQQLTATWRDNTMANLKTCMAAGVTLASGTDAGNPGTFHGLALARELSLYVEAGMSPVDALVTATRTAADVLRRPDLGRLAPGAKADVLVVDGDATKDIGALRRVARVYKGGSLVDRAALALPAKTSLTRKPTTGVAAGGTCLGPSECGPGLTCDFDAVCVRTCSGFGGCAGGSACLPDLDDPNSGYCYPSDHCDPIAQSCVNGTACVPLGNGATACWYAGTGSNGQPCSPEGTCAVGSTCSFTTNTCMDLCDPAGVSGRKCPLGKKCKDASSWTGLAVGLCQ